ncbi:MAG TPA: M23 family metallopeptidase [Chondromyces sp.]|nr:M23 family metallopeptidase [Chondromyces sp.]
MREEEKKQTSRSMKNFFKKRWVFPAIYLVCAAFLITGIVWYQMGSQSNEEEYGYEEESAGQESFDNPAVEVNTALENIAVPVKNPDAVVVQKEFYDEKASEEQQESALVVYNNTYHPNTGIDYTVKDGKSFDVVAALSGKVTKVQTDSLLGNVIEIEHQNGVTTQYQSVKDFQVAEGDEVKQGQVIAKAGQSLFNEEAGIHVHFEIRKDNIPVNPQDYFNKPVTSLTEQTVEDEKEVDSQQDQAPAEELEEPSAEEGVNEEAPQSTETPEEEEKQSEKQTESNS